MKNPILLSVGVALSLASCAGDADTAARKKSVSIGRFGVTHNAVAEVPADAPAGAPVQEAAAAGANNATAAQQQSAPEPAIPAPAKPEAKKEKSTAANGDGIRLPSMLGLPEDKDLKATNPTVPKSNEGGAVISRPPTEKKD